ncbi:MAG: nucleotidyltransferase domain-containing protein [Pseudomonadota bacterium]
MNIQNEKRLNSQTKLNQLKSQLAKENEVTSFPDLAIFVAGSYARSEASIHSDIDLFFVLNGELKNVDEPNIRSLRMFSSVVKVADNMGFPKFSNDGQYLKVLEKPRILSELGGPNDDHLNFFTARMLMILESHCVHGDDNFESVLQDILGAYFRDYPDHPKEFIPTFLVNDIIRFWKTLCLNYEHKRNQPEDERARVIKQKIKNLKLKFSRMLTCYASICYIVSLENPIGTTDLLEMSKIPPMERLKKVVDDHPEVIKNFKEIEQEYSWFLSLTNVSEEQLQIDFSSRELRESAFMRASSFGENLYEVTKEVAEKHNYLRFLLI